MARILLTWELGEGLGHLVGLRPLVLELVRRGHQMFVASKDVSCVSLLLRHDQISLLQAPTKIRKLGNELARAWTFAHILHDCGFNNESYLTSMVEAWRNLMRLVGPDVVLIEHSPSALVAARTLGLKRILVGTGFVCPPDIHPLPNLRFWEPSPPPRLAEPEQLVLKCLNRVLLHYGAPPTPYVARLFAEVDDTLLVTFRELDHYIERPGNPRYWGATTHVEGDRPTWECSGAKRVFAYFKPFAKIDVVLQAIADCGHETIVFASGVEDRLRRKYSSARLRFHQRPLDLRVVARECDVGVLNGTHGTTIAMLMAGKPTLHLPMYVEQRMISGLVKRLGAGGGVPMERPELLAPALARLLADHSAAAAARAFAARHADFDPAQAAVDMADRIETVLA